MCTQFENVVNKKIVLQKGNDQLLTKIGLNKMKMKQNKMLKQNSSLAKRLLINRKS